MKYTAGNTKLNMLVQIVGATSQASIMFHYKKDSIYDLFKF